MCEPISVGMGVMAIAGAASSIMAQQQAASAGDATEEARRIEQDNVIEENRRRASEDYLNTVRLTQTRQEEEHSAVVQKVSDVRQQQAHSVATAGASAAERGVTGRTVDQIMSDYAFMASEEAGRLHENQSRADRQHGETIRAAQTEFNVRSTSIRPYVKQMQKPVDYFSPIFQAAGQTMGTYSAVQKSAGPGGSIPAVTGGAGVQTVGGLSKFGTGASPFLVNTPR